MKKSTATLLATACVCVSTFAEESLNPIALFNGNDFDGWTMFMPDETIDPSTVWSIQDGVIHCTGQPFCYMRTEKTYENYRLTVEWRWPGEATNSGVFLHAQEPDTVWPFCIEAQLKNNRAGDFVLMGQTTRFEGQRERKGFFGGVSKKGVSAEKPIGEWNRYEILCEGDTIELSVNGQVMNTATGATLTKGHIALQSEGGPIEFRNIQLTPIAE